MKMGKLVKKLDAVDLKLSAIFSSNKFFVAILVLFVLQAVWVAFSLNHAGFYDEQYHYAVSEIFSQQSNPFTMHQEQPWDRWGDLTRHTSYLYYYANGVVMDIVGVFTDSFMYKLTVLRLVSVVCFTLGLVVFRRVLLEVGFSRKLTHISLLFLTSIPVFPLIAGQVNYDNPMFLWGAIFLLFGVRIVKSKEPRLLDVGWLVFAGVVASLMKSMFLPVLAAGVIGIVIFYGWRFRKKIRDIAKSAWINSSTWHRVAAVSLVVCGGLLFMERYGLNYVIYHSLQPGCEQVMEVSRCSSNIVWVRDQRWIEAKPEDIDTDIFKFIGDWSSGMVTNQFNLAFLTGIDTDMTPHAILKAPLPVVFSAYQLLILAAAILFIRYYRYVLHSKERVYTFLVTLFFMLSLTLLGWNTLHTYGVLAATNGRYWLPVFPILIAFGATLMAMHLRKVRYGVNIGILVLFLTLTQGGGIISTVLQAEPSWLWPKQKVQYIHEKLHNILAPVVKEDL
jgi:hypothetical protein